MCSGSMEVTPLVCPDHDPPPGRVCGTCGTIFRVRFYCVCSVCNHGWYASSDRHIVTHPTVHAFYHDHGYDPFGHGWLRLEPETFARQRVSAEDPLEVQTTLRIDGDELVVTLDGDGTVGGVDG